MLPRVRRRPGAIVTLAALAACLLLLSSFIVFEVLDLDGSDFPRPTRTIGSLGPNLTEPPHDVKRGQVYQNSMPFVVPPTLRLAGWTGVADFQRRVLSTLALGHHAARAARVTLPRSSVPEPPPLA